MELTVKYLSPAPCSCCCPTVLQTATCRETLGTLLWCWAAPSITVRLSAYWYVQEHSYTESELAHRILYTCTLSLCSYIKQEEIRFSFSISCAGLYPIDYWSAITALHYHHVLYWLPIHCSGCHSLSFSPLIPVYVQAEAWSTALPAE